MAAGIASIEYMVKNRLDKKLRSWAICRERLRSMKGKYPLIKDVEAGV